MSHPDFIYEAMIYEFRIRDLKSLLEFFYCTKSGNKTILKNRVLQILRCKPKEIHNDTFKSKIVEIFTNLPKKNQLAHSANYQNMNVSFQLYPLLFSLPSLPPPPLKSFELSDNKINDSHQSVDPSEVRNTVMQQREAYMNSMSNDMRDSIVPKLKFTKLPFYEINDVVLQPSFMPKDSNEISINICLLFKHANLITLNRDMSYGCNEYVYQMQIRIFSLKSKKLEIADCLPLELNIQVNGEVCTLPPYLPAKYQNETRRRIPVPISFTEHLKLRPKSNNLIHIKWLPDDKTYLYAVHFVKKLSSKLLLQKLIDKGGKTFEQTKNYIIHQLGKVDLDLPVTCNVFSLLCPLTKTRMSIPAKSINCIHLKCFDAYNFILMNETKPTWICPNCFNPCLYDDLQIDPFFSNILSSPNLSVDCQNIEILPNGTWKPYEEQMETIGLNNSSDVNRRVVDLTVVVDSDDKILET